MLNILLYMKIFLLSHCFYFTGSSMFNDIKATLLEGVQKGCYPGAVLLVAHGGSVVFLDAVGFRTLLPHTFPMDTDTFFDLASLTKVLATTMCIMMLTDRGLFGLDQSIADILSQELPKDKREITPRMLLNHCSGLPSWRPFYLDLIMYPSVERKVLLRKWIIEQPLVYPPASKTVYSDLGFMMLEWIIEVVSNKDMDELVLEDCVKDVSFSGGFFNDNGRPFPGEDMFAATEKCRWRKRILQGEVHDENAYALGGFAGHAGMFGRARDVYEIINLMRECFYGRKEDFISRDTVLEFFTRQNIVKGSSWALGWDTPSAKGSSAGRFISRNSVGHLGFTGTSVWMDLDRDVQVILLTNRIHPNRSNEKIRLFRPMIHDMIMSQYL